jgi:hypothetical protein
MPNSQPLFVDIGEGLMLMIGLPTIVSWDSQTRPKNLKRGTFGFNTQTNTLEYWTGSYWVGASMSEK